MDLLVTRQETRASGEIDEIDEIDGIDGIDEIEGFEEFEEFEGFDPKSPCKFYRIGGCCYFHPHLSTK